MSRITHDICDMLHVPHHEVPNNVQRTNETTGRRLVLAGGNGYLGRLLTQHFTSRGWNVVVLTRHPRTGRDRDARLVEWDGKHVGNWANQLEGAGALINLAGRSVNCRYHARNRKEMMDSRIDSTRALGQAVQRCARPPRVWLNASTATIYQHTFGPAWTETGKIGATPDVKDEFSIEIATAWERAFDEFETPNTRKVKLRSAMVLGRGSAPNNAFIPLARLARIGLGGSMGSGRQFVSWIHETDFCCALEFIIANESIHDTVNVAAPEPLSNAAMMKTLRQAVGMPIGLAAPNWMLELGAFLLRTETELIIKSRRVMPRKLLDAGFRFAHCTFGDAASDILHRDKQAKTDKRTNINEDTQTHSKCGRGSDAALHY